MGWSVDVLVDGWVDGFFEELVDESVDGWTFGNLFCLNAWRRYWPGEFV